MGGSERHSEDDIFVYSKTEEGHNKILNGLFQRLQAPVVLRVENCNNLQLEVKYLAHTVDENLLNPDPGAQIAVAQIIRLNFNQLKHRFSEA